MMARDHVSGQKQICNPAFLLFCRSVQADDSDQLQNNHQRDAPDFVHHTKARCDFEDSNRQQKVIELSTLRNVILAAPDAVQRCCRTISEASGVA
jgi:hypothetical protein